MFKGFYQLTSGMLSQGRRLDVVANNMTNISTVGYRADRYTDSTFQEHMMSRVGNQDKRGYTEIGPASYILAPSQLYTDYSQGALEETEMPLDFAIEGDGFFAIQTANGVGYTRNGNFTLDEEGYLSMSGKGQVLDITGAPIQLLTDKVRGDIDGSIYTKDGGFLGQLGVYAFPDNAQLQRDADGFFTGGQAAAAPAALVRHGSVERANVDMIQQMTMMMTSQRALQSAAQLSKMYDGLMNKAANDVGRM